MTFTFSDALLFDHSDQSGGGMFDTSRSIVERVDLPLPATISWHLVLLDFTTDEKSTVTVTTDIKDSDGNVVSEGSTSSDPSTGTLGPIVFRSFRVTVTGAYTLRVIRRRIGLGRYCAGFLAVRFH